MDKKLVEIATQIMVMAVVLSVMLLFIGIGVLFLVHICFLGRRLRRASGAARRPGDGGARKGLLPEDLEKLPCYDFKVGEDSANETAAECAVCLEIFQPGDRCRLLPACRHSFHAQCVDSWLMKSTLCPTCRTSTACQRVGKAAEGDAGGGGERFGLEIIREGRQGMVILEISSAAAQQASPALPVTLDV